MLLKCKLCPFVCSVRPSLLKHYRLDHFVHSTICPIPCLYEGCMCTFKSYNSLKIHLTRFHPEKQETHGCEKSREFHCPLCTLKQPFVEQDMFCHLRSHLKKFERVTFPYRNCYFQTNNYSTFNSHKWREHHNASEYNDMMVKSEVSEQQNSGSEDEVSESHSVLEPTALDTSQLFDKLQHNLAA